MSWLLGRFAQTGDGPPSTGAEGPPVGNGGPEPPDNGKRDGGNVVSIV